MKRISPSLYAPLVFLYAIFCLTACQEESNFSEDAPYSVRAQRYRTLPEAQQTLQRVQEKGLPAYLVLTDDDEDGQWFSVLIGAAESLEQMMEQKISYEDRYGVKELQIVNFNKMRDSILPIRPEKHSLVRTTAFQPDLGREFYTFLGQLPYTAYYRPTQARVFQNADTLALHTLPTFKDLQLDLPRGISQLALLKNSRYVAEVVYEDDLSYQKMTLQAFALAPNHALGDSIAYYLSQKILDTRHYEVEEMIPVALGKQLGVQGYWVNITPRPEQLKRYLVFLDAQQRYLFFLQSDTNQAETMESFAKLIGETQGLQEYVAFQNTFHTLPRNFFLEDSFLSYELALQRNVEGTVAGLREGEYKARFLLHTLPHGVWEIALLTTSDIRVSQRIFNSLYTPDKRVSKDSLQVFGQQAWLTNSRRIHPQERKTAEFPNELRFATDKFICTFSNRNRAWLNREEMLARARAGQFVVSFVEVSSSGGVFSSF